MSTSLQFKQGWSPFRLFDEYFSGGQPFFFPFQLPGAAVRAPQTEVNVDEAHRVYIVRAELPGIAESEIKLTFTPGEIELRAERVVDSKAELKFFRKIALPDGIDHLKIKASLQHGVLDITVPFPTEADKLKSAFVIPISKL